MTTAIRAEGLVKRFGDTVALNGVDLSVPAGTVLAVLGPNGSGKTTCVRILATLISPDEGTASVLGYDLATQKSKVRGLIGLTGQFAAVDENLTGVENLVFLARLLGQSRPQAAATARDLLERFGLTDAGGRPARGYSGGMRRRLDLAASLVGEPSVIFLDEPTTGLDPNAREQLWEVIRGEVARGVTILLTTQYLEEADQLADDVLVINKGSVVAGGSPAQLKARIGGQTLQVRPADPARIADVTAVISALVGRPDVQNGLATVSVDDSAVVPEVFRRLDQAGVPLLELSIRQPSLDEVFRQLTTQGATA